jgi:two-component system, chemotaxis family, protein-glutamate methylesterase/glutaminase
MSKYLLDINWNNFRLSFFKVISSKKIVLKRNIIVIGASAGGFEAIKKLVSHLPAEIDASIFIVWHMAAELTGVLPNVLNKLSKIPAAHAVDMEPIVPNRIYVARPDWHLVVENERVRVTRGPKENRFRPAVDPLFRSAAYAYGPRVIGVVLSGALDDGTAGLWTIKHYGGVAIVQDPEEAGFPSMPESALLDVDVDYKESIAGISARLVNLIQESVDEKVKIDMDEIDKTKYEVRVAMLNEGVDNKEMKFGRLSPYSCPECHGVLSAVKDGDRIRFRCHTGHAYSPDSLLSVLSENIEASLWAAVRGADEAIILLNNMGDHYAAMNAPKIAAAYFKEAKKAGGRVTNVRKALLDNEPLSANLIEREVDENEGNTIE